MFHVKREAMEPGHASDADGRRGRCPPPDLPELSAGMEAAIEPFLGLLLRWNSRINLVSGHDAALIRERHVIDSLQLLPLLPPGDAPIADLGSGGGFPGLVLAIGTRRPVHLIESDRRKAAFLTECAARLSLAHVRVHASRIEDARLPPLAAVTARALAPLPELLRLAAPLLAPGGVGLFPKGRSAEGELTAARAAWTFKAERFASRTDPEATLLRLSDIAPAPHV
jgi:16S rRNA (guanine527-N7)-methyltransferase